MNSVCDHHYETIQSLNQRQCVYCGECDDIYKLPVYIKNTKIIPQKKALLDKILDEFNITNAVVINKVNYILEDITKLMYRAPNNIKIVLAAIYFTYLLEGINISKEEFISKMHHSRYKIDIAFINSGIDMLCDNVLPHNSQQKNMICRVYNDIEDLIRSILYQLDMYKEIHDVFQFYHQIEKQHPYLFKGVNKAKTYAYFVIYEYAKETNNSILIDRLTSYNQRVSDHTLDIVYRQYKLQPTV